MTDLTKVDGFIAAPLTGFYPDGRLNLDIIPEYARFLHGNGVAGVFVNGTTGEGFSLTVEERLATAEWWVQAAPRDFKVIVHVSHTCVPIVYEMAKHAAQIGAFGIGEMGPIFYKPPSIDALVDYAAGTAEQAPNLPYFYYHMPSMSGVCFPMVDFLRLAAKRIPNLTGIKYTHEDLVDYKRCLDFEECKYAMLYGRDETLLCALALGCRGAVGSTYNIMAPLYAKLKLAFENGNREEAERLQDLSMQVIRLLIDTTSFNSALKAVMALLGYDLGGVCSPLRDIKPEARGALEKGLKQLGFFNFANKG